MLLMRGAVNLVQSVKMSFGISLKALRNYHVNLYFMFMIIS